MPAEHHLDGQSYLDVAAEHTCSQVGSVQQYGAMIAKNGWISENITGELGASSMVCEVCTCNPKTSCRQAASRQKSIWSPAENDPDAVA